MTVEVELINVVLSKGFFAGYASDYEKTVVEISDSDISVEGPMLTFVVLNYVKIPYFYRVP